MRIWTEDDSKKYKNETLSGLAKWKRCRIIYFDSKRQAPCKGIIVNMPIFKDGSGRFGGYFFEKSDFEILPKKDTYTIDDIKEAFEAATKYSDFETYYKTLL